MRIKAAMGALLALRGVVVLVGCKDSLEDQVAAWEKFVSKNRYGSDADVWLVKHNAFGDWERVALIFGFTDDRSFCDDVATLHMKKYPADRYRCDKAN